MHGTALIIGQRGQGLLFAAVLYCFQAGREIIQRCLCGLHLGAVSPQRVCAGGDDICRRVGTGGQLLAQGITVVGRNAGGEPLAGIVILPPDLGTAKAHERRQHDHHAQHKGCALLCQCGGQRLFQPGQLLLQGVRRTASVSGRFASR